mmetsp:Transcript_54453/g.115656  ORF Transcript_54453/g.115656 Transcript_54453/m.115656 type:complete len:200 (-) Transcript_54453:1790-2389(-)
MADGPAILQGENRQALAAMEEDDIGPAHARVLCIVPLLADQTPRHCAAEDVRLPAITRTTTAAAWCPSFTAAAARCSRSTLSNAAQPGRCSTSAATTISPSSSLIFVQQIAPSLLPQRLPPPPSDLLPSVKPPHADAPKLPVVPELVGKRPTLWVQHRRPEVRHALLRRRHVVPLEEGVLVVEVGVEDVKRGKVGTTAG